MILRGCFKPHRIKEIRRAISAEVLLCTPATIAMLAAATAITLTDLGTPTVPMATVKLPVITEDLKIGGGDYDEYYTC